jgi:hypothetical protein
MVSSHTHSNSLSARMRKKRMRFMDDAIARSSGSNLAVADLGGTRSFWEMNLCHLEDASRIGRIDVFNLEEPKEEITLVDGVEIREMKADVTLLSQVVDSGYDIAFSNSVIEHVGNLYAQDRFAGEIRRIARRYVVQTPNRHFPLEPHFYVPFFPYLPLGVRSWLHQRFRLGWLMQEPDPLRARIDCDQVRLLNRRELALLFPKAGIHAEWLCGMVKSYILTGEVES